MRTTIFTAALLLLSPVLAHPQPIPDIQVVERAEVAAIEGRFADAPELWKRKGGGGKGGKGGSGSSSSGSAGNGKGSTSSNTGGATKQGSGVQPSYSSRSGARYYGGGSASPYTSGGRSPLGITPLFFGVAALGVLGSWRYPYGAYSYPYNHPYTFRNHTASNSTSNSTSKRDTLEHLANLLARQDSTTGVNETKPVDCLCAAYAECGCDDNGDTTFLDSIIRNGSYANLNLSVVDVVDVNGTSTIILNGTLENGTTTSGGTDDANGAAGHLPASGLVIAALVGCAVYLL